MTTSSEFPEKPRSKSRDRISSFMLKKSSTSLESTTPWSKAQSQSIQKNETGLESATCSEGQFLRTER